jgi:hypothetical protein
MQQALDFHIRQKAIATFWLLQPRPIISLELTVVDFPE